MKTIESSFILCAALCYFVVHGYINAHFYYWRSLFDSKNQFDQIWQEKHLNTIMYCMYFMILITLAYAQIDPMLLVAISLLQPLTYFAIYAPIRQTLNQSTYYCSWAKTETKPIKNTILFLSLRIASFIAGAIVFYIHINN